MYDDAKFTLLPGICTRDTQTGVITASTVVTAPQHPGANIATTYADGIHHQEALELWHNYESACKFVTKALDHAFGSALLDKQDENGALTDEAKGLYQALWTNKMTGMMKDREIRTADRLLIHPLICLIPWHSSMLPTKMVSTFLLNWTKRSTKIR